MVNNRVSFWMPIFARSIAPVVENCVLSGFVSAAMRVFQRIDVKHRSVGNLILWKRCLLTSSHLTRVEKGC